MHSMSEKEEIRKREWYEKNRELCIERAIKWNRENKKRHGENAAKYRKRLRIKALKLVAEHWGDDIPRCRVDSLPHNHHLFNVECFGQLQIDHMNGDGNHESGFVLYRNIVRGRLLNDLRVLCALHNLWNWQFQYEISGGDL